MLTFYFSFSQKARNRTDLRQAQNVRVSWRIKIQLATASAAATIYQRCHYVWACCASFLALFSEPRRFGSTSLFSTSCPSVIEEDTRRAVARHCLEIWMWILLDKYRAGLQILLPQVCEMCFVIRIYREQKKLLENVIFTIIRVISRFTTVLTWAASLGWTSAVTRCNIYREHHVPVFFEFLQHIYVFVSSVRDWFQGFY